VKNSHGLLLSAVLLGGSYSSITTATVIDFGIASNYNVFVQNDFVAANSDVEGRLAAGGDVAITSYSVNSKNGSQLYSDTTTNPALLVGGDLSFNNGQVSGDVYVQGNYTPIASGNILNGSLNSDTVSSIDFNATFSDLTQLSENLSALSSNSSAIDKWTTQYLTGTGSNDAGGDLHIFSLDVSDLYFSNYLLSGVDAGDTVLFNVSGDNISTGWGNFAGSDFSLSDLSANIVYNFYEANSINLTAAMYGSILAPTADIYSTYGVIEGQVIAASWNGNFQVNDNPFVSSVSSNSNSVSVPAPTGMIFLLLGLLTLTMRRQVFSKIR